jgi:ribosomal protein S27E
MGIRTEYQAVVSCDYCGENLVEAYWRQKEVIKEAREMGWSIGKTVKCPKCKKRLAPQEGR